MDKTHRAAYRQLLEVVGHDADRARAAFRDAYGCEPAPGITALEVDIQKAAVSRMTAAGYMAIVHDAGNKTGGAGRPGHSRRAAAGRVPPAYPDVTVHCGLGATLLLEFKRPGQNATDEQKAMHLKLEALGVRVRVVKTVDEAMAACYWQIERFKEVGRLVPYFLDASDGLAYD